MPVALTARRGLHPQAEVTVLPTRWKPVRHRTSITHEMRKRYRALVSFTTTRAGYIRTAIRARVPAPSGTSRRYGEFRSSISILYSITPQPGVRPAFGAHPADGKDDSAETARWLHSWSTFTNIAGDLRSPHAREYQRLADGVRRLPQVPSVDSADDIKIR